MAHCWSPHKNAESRGDIKQSRNEARSLPFAAATEDQTGKKKIKERWKKKIPTNNNVTQRFIECNKRNKYRGFFPSFCPGFAKSKSLFTIGLRPRAKLARYEGGRESLIAFGHFKNSFRLLNILIFIRPFPA